MPHPKAILLVLLLALGLSASVASAQSSVPEDRIILEATINQQPARFLFDTGASFTALFAQGAGRLHLQSETNRTIQIAGHPVTLGLTPPVDFVLFGKPAKTKLPILPFASVAGCDGVLSWQTLLNAPIYIDAPNRSIRSVNELPTTGWQHWSLGTNSTQVFFQVTQEGKPLGRVFVDTGSSLGLRISPALWKKWRQQHPDAGVTLTTYRYSVGAPMVHELSWASEYRLGDLLFHHVDIGPIPEAKDGQAIGGDGQEFIATIGIGALQHLRMIISRDTKEVLTQSISPIPEHNRLGAVFVPAAKDPVLVAHVLENTPAARAGLKNGDILQSVNEVDFRSAGKNPEPFFSQAAGTVLAIKITRGQTPHEFSVTLQDLLHKD